MNSVQCGFCLSVDAIEEFRKTALIEKEIDIKGTDPLIMFLQKADQMIRLIHWKLLLEI